MKKTLLLALLGVLVFGFISISYATNWAEYESGRNNIRLDGYNGQSGYISFTNGSGTVVGYLWMHPTYGLVFASRSAVDLTSMKLDDLPICGAGSNEKNCFRRISTAYNGV